MPATDASPGCQGCRGSLLDFDFSMAFQPIVDIAGGGIFAHEALVRGLGGEGAASVLGRVDAGNRYAFDQTCRVKAVEWAARLGMQSHLSINFLPNAVYQPAACIRRTLQAAEEFGFPANRIIFEVTEGEQVRQREHLVAIFRDYRERGFLTAIDDFGAGHSGLNLLAEFQPDIIKIDMELLRNIDSHRPRQAIVRATLAMCRDLGIEVVAEGIETAAEAAYLQQLGIRYMQGYWFAKPAFQALPPLSAEAMAEITSLIPGPHAQT